MMNLNNFTVPLNRTVMTDKSLKLSLEEQLKKDIFISSLNLTTNAGAFWRTQVNVSHLIYENESAGTSERLAGIKQRW